MTLLTYIKPIRALTVFAITIILLPGCLGLSSRTPSGIPIESDPSGANVYIMGDFVGKTPTHIKSEDAYPVSYSLDKEKLYGRVIIKKKGCKDYSRSLTRDDNNEGFKVRLDCVTHIPSTKIKKEPTEQVIRPKQDRYSKDKKLDAEKRLKQLRVLQQLVDEGFLAEEKEKILRKRILDSE